MVDRNVKYYTNRIDQAVKDIHFLNQDLSRSIPPGKRSALMKERTMKFSELKHSFKKLSDFVSGNIITLVYSVGDDSQKHIVSYANCQNIQEAIDTLKYFLRNLGMKRGTRLYIYKVSITKATGISERYEEDKETERVYGSEVYEKYDSSL